MTERFLRDLRFALRRALGQPRLSLIVVGSFAVAIGFAATVFSFLDALFFRSLPVAEPHRLVAVYGLDEANPGYLPVSYPNFQDLRAGAESLEGMAAYQWVSLNLLDGERSRRLVGQVVSGNFFELLGVAPESGRTFAAGDEEVVVLSRGVADRLFGGTGSALGRTVRLNDARYAVIGVAPARFKGIGAMGVVSGFWLPMSAYERVSPFGHLRDDRSARLFAMVGRLAPGVSREAAGAELRGLAAHLRREFPDQTAGFGLAVRPLDQSIIDPNRRDRFVLGGRLLTALAALLVLVACFNGSNLLLIDAVRRRGEMALRLALGAGTGQLARQLLAEGAVLALGGGLLGCALAVVLQRVLWSLRPPFFSQDSYLSVGPDVRVLGFALAASLAAGLLASVAPVLDLGRPDLVSRLKLGGWSAPARSRKLGLRNQHVAFQVGLAVVALTAAFLFVRSLQQVLSIDPGIDADRLILLQYDLGGEAYDERRGLEFGRRVIERVTALPGIEGAALGAFPPLTPFHPQEVVEVRDGPAPGEGKPIVRVGAVEGRYFATVGLRLLRGRVFSEADRSDTEPVAVINRTMAERFWGGPSEAIGRTFLLGGNGSEIRVVGVVETSKYGSLGEEPQPYLYRPAFQAYRSRMTLHARAERDPELLVETVRREVQSLDLDLPLIGVQTLEERIRDSLWAARLAAAVVSLVGIVCLLLASAGIYGAIAFSVRERRRELGIRMALGGSARGIVGRVVGESMTVAAAGVAMGAVLAGWLLRLAEGMLFGLGAMDLASWAGAIALLAAVALVASYLPARRAARIDPVIALREG